MNDNFNIIGTLIAIVVVIFGAGFGLATILDEDSQFTDEQVLKVYACGRGDGEVLTYPENDDIGCLVNGEVFLVEYDGGSQFLGDEPVPQISATSTN